MNTPVPEPFFTLSLLLFALCVAPRAVASDGSYAFMDVTKASSSDGSKVEKRICLNYDNSVDIAHSHDSATEHKLALRNSTVVLCEESKLPELKSGSVATTTLPLNLTLACSVTTLGQNAQSAGASALLVILDPPRSLWSSFKTPYINYSKVNIPVYLISRDNYNDFIESFGEGGEAKVRFYQPSKSSASGSLVVVLLIGMIPLVVGGYWSGIDRHKLYLEFLDSKLYTKLDEVTAMLKKRPDTVRHICAALTIVLVVSCYLLLFYYVYWLAVWYVIVVFMFGSAIGMYNCLVVFWDKGPKFLHIYLPFSPSGVWHKIFRDKWKYLSEKPIDLTHVILYVACLALSIFWVVKRNEWYAFILQDILGIFFCIHLLRTVFVKNLKRITYLLVGFFIYDIVFVFVTPLFTKSGCSIMLDAATGGVCSIRLQQEKAVREPIVGDLTTPWEWPQRPEEKHIEQLPILFRIPQFSDPLKQCKGPNEDLMPSMLGYGDVVVPGLLVAYCHAFDLAWNIPFKSYYVVSLIGYVIGIAITGLVLVLSGKAQPALLYLVPATMIAVHGLAFFRKQWREIWECQLPLPTDDDSPAKTIRPDEISELKRREEKKRESQLLIESKAVPIPGSAAPGPHTSDLDPGGDSVNQEGDSVTKL